MGERGWEREGEKGVGERVGKGDTAILYIQLL